MKWKDITKGFRFKDNSVIDSLHQKHLYPCYTLYYDNRNITLSKDHLLDIDISGLSVEARTEIEKQCGKGKIPIKENVNVTILGHVSNYQKQSIEKYITGELRSPTDFSVSDISELSLESYIFTFPQDIIGKEVFVKRIPIAFETQKISENRYWIPVEGVAYLLNKYGPVQCNGHQIYSAKNVGKLECFCVTTDTGHYEVNGLRHHNSVMIQNVIIHCLEHRDKIAIGMVDPKQVEFSNYKGMNGVVGVANNTREAVELLRIARLVMLKRNKEMANLGIKSLTEYKPSKRSGKEYITGRDFNEHDMLKVRINGEEQQMSASDFVDYLHTDFSLEAEVCLNGTDWITVNGNCCDHRYEDEFPILLIVVDELAELTQKGGLKTTEGKEEDAMKDEIIGIIQSITQLGRSAGVLMMLATQKPNASIVPTVIRSNPLSLDTYVEVVDD